MSFSTLAQRTSDDTDCTVWPVQARALAHLAHLGGSSPKPSPRMSDPAGYVPGPAYGLDVSHPDRGAAAVVPADRTVYAAGEIVQWTAPGSLEAVTSGKVGAHGIQEAASR